MTKDIRCLACQVSPYNPCMSCEIRAHNASRRAKPTCLSCDEPREDAGDGRFCPACQDYEGACVNDHCLTCGAST